MTETKPAVHTENMTRHAAILAVPFAMFIYSVQGLYFDFRAELSADGEGEAVAQVRSTEGDVKRRPPQRFRWFEAGEETELFKGDSLRTAEGAGTKIGFEDGGELDVGESSLIVLQRTASGKLNIQLGGGQLKYKAGKDSKAEVQIQVGDRKFAAAGASASFARKQGITTVDVAEGAVEQVGVKDAKPITKSNWLKVDALGQAQTFSKPAVLLEPKSGASFVIQSEQASGLRVKFKWKPVQVADRVQLEVSSSADFKAIVQAVEVSGATHTLALPPGQYHWRVRGVGKAATSFTEPLPLLIARREGVAPLTPSAGQHVTVEEEAGNVLFSWKAPSYYQKFRIQVSKDPEFSELVVNEEVVGSKILLPLGKTGKFYWRVEGASEALKLTQTSDPQEFRVIRPIEREVPAPAPVAVAAKAEAPAAPVAAAKAPEAPAAPAAKAAAPQAPGPGTFTAKLNQPPADAKLRAPTGSESANAPVEFQFETVPHQKQARVRIWKLGAKADERTQVANEIVDLRSGRGGIRWKADSPGKYEWEVIPAEASRAPASVTAGARPFSVEREYLAIKTEDLVGSGDYQQNRIKAGGKIPLNWKAYPKAQSYRVVISDSANMAKVISEHETAKPTVDVDAMQALKGTMYYRVIAKLENGFTVTSKVEQLVLRLPAPAPVVPPDNIKFRSGDVPAGGILVTWSKTGDVEGYLLEVARDPAFKDVAVKKASVENFVLLKGLAPGNYFWRVSGNAKQIRSAYSKPQRINIVR